MSGASAVGATALLTAIVALVIALRAHRLLLSTRAELEALSAALAQERQATAESIAVAHHSTVDEVTGLLENLLTQIDTDITAKVAEALVHRTP